MLGLLITVLFSLGAAGVGRFVLRRLTSDLDPALAFGVHGLAGLAVIGMLTLPIALLPGGTNWGIYVVGALALAGYGPLWQGKPSMGLPKGGFLLVPLAALLAGLCSLIGVLSPSDSFDWDTLAYHLAVPKMWIHDGRMHYVSFIHQSNFPLTVDGLYIWGLDWGGQPGAKAFSLCFAIYGAIALFGLGRARYGGNAGWWSVLAYVSIPMVAWEAGTAYIDVSNGLFVGLGILFAAEYARSEHGIRQSDGSSNFDPAPSNSCLWLSAIFLGFAAGSKYTGLQTIFAVAVVLAAAAFLASRSAGKGAPSVQPLRSIAAAALLSLLIGSPWYVRNVINTGNPVFPFFYSVFKGKNWDAFSDAIYKEQQQTFGSGRAEGTPDRPYTSNALEPSRIGAAILGLAYQPGRYADPAPEQGLGFPFVGLGAIPLAGLLVWMFSGRLSRFEGVVAGTVLLSLAMWFVLSEQSRYILGLALPLCVLAGGAVSRLRVGPLIAVAMAVQLLASIYVVTRYGDRFSEKLKVVLGGETPDDYLARNAGFFAVAQDLNSMPGVHRVGLFDEVFGYFLDVPYFWAGPGHSTEIGYEQISSADQLVAALKRLGIDVVYINLGQTYGQDGASIERWIQASGVKGNSVPYKPSEREPAMKDPRNKYKVLLAEAVASHKLTLVKAYGSRGARLVFQVAP